MGAVKFGRSKSAENEPIIGRRLSINRLNQSTQQTIYSMGRSKTNHADRESDTKLTQEVRGRLPKNPPVIVPNIDKYLGPGTLEVRDDRPMMVKNATGFTCL